MYIPSGDVERLLDSPKKNKKIFIVGNYYIYIGNVTSHSKYNNSKHIFYAINKDGRTKLQNIVTREVWEPFSNKLFISVDNYINKWGIQSIKNIVDEKTLVQFKKIYKIKKITEQAYTNVQKELLEEGKIDKQGNKIKQPGESKMKSNMNEIMSANTNAAQVAAQITAGKTINKAVVAKIKPQLPMMVRGYADSALAPVIAANLISFAVTSFASDNNKAVWVADAMMVAAMSEFMENFNVDKMLAEVLATVDVEVPTE